MIEKHLKSDKNKLDELLTQGGIKTFSDNFYRLSIVWFGGETHNEITEKMEMFLPTGHLSFA